VTSIGRMADRIWFITGASRGFGREWTKAALERGDRVAATARDTATLDDAIELLLATSQHDFPVVNAAGDVAGILTRHDIFSALRKTGPDTPVVEIMRTGIPTVPAGIGSETTTPAGSSDGPLLVTVIVYVVCVPATTDATLSVLAIARSADFVTVLVSVAALFAGVGSGSVALTVATLFRVPPAVGVKTNVAVRNCPVLMNGHVHLTTPPVGTVSHVPPAPELFVAETNVEFAGTVSLMTTVLAAELLRF